MHISTLQLQWPFPLRSRGESCLVWKSPPTQLVTKATPDLTPTAQQFLPTDLWQCKGTPLQWEPSSPLAERERPQADLHSLLPANPSQPQDDGTFGAFLRQHGPNLARDPV